MITIDLNCDMGEGSGTDRLVMPFISSANIACGYHAGNVQTMLETVAACLQYGVAIGAHPSFHDRENFGRSESNISPGETYQLVTQQLGILAGIVKQKGAALHHVKPHGALYNRAANDILLAAAIAKSVKDFDEQLILYGLSGSYSISEAGKIGLQTASEVFADRSYRDDGTLTPRKDPHALIDDPEKAVAQVLQMINEKTVRSLSGKRVPIIAETICIHGDGEKAVDFAKMIHHHLKRDAIDIKTI